MLRLSADHRKQDIKCSKFLFKIVFDIDDFKLIEENKRFKTNVLNDK